MDAQKDRTSAETAFVEAVTDYAITQMAFLRDTETLWVRTDGQYESRDFHAKLNIKTYGAEIILSPIVDERMSS